MSLTTLPPELFGCVAANIESQSALCNLARCSRQLYLCTIPHLYYHVQILEEIKYTKQPNGKISTVASLLRRPHLAGLVQNVTLGVKGPPGLRAAWPEESERFIAFTVPQEVVLDFKPMSSFIGFKNLKVLKIDAIFLQVTETGSNTHKLVNMFPPGLETLHLSRLSGSVHGILEAVDYLLAQKSPHQIPLLKNLILSEPETVFEGYDAKLTEVLWKDTSERAIERLARVGARQGVHIDEIRSLYRFPLNARA
ncbi:hypothetical protein MMC07_006260 [Pseudocyphellaria aurata]|nr:hypothetical protein [Pseudocyphellaria aurata]